MRIAMIGAGAMGAMFGARLARAGADVVLFDRDAEHVAAIHRDGLVVETPGAPLHLRVPATGAAEALGAVDLAIVLVDSNATASVAAILAEVLPPRTPALTLQNGIGNVEALTSTLGAERVLGGSTYNSAAKLAAGRVLHSNIGETTLGELDGSRSARIEEVAELFRRAGLPVVVSDSVVGTIWMKFILNAAINPVCAITGLRPGEAARVESARRLMEALLDEILAVATAKGLSLPVVDPRAYVLDHAWERYNRPSMLQHVEQGRRTEIEALNGALVREAASLDIACPVNETVANIVRAMEARAGLRGEATGLDEAALEAAARANPRPGESPPALT